MLGRLGELLLFGVTPLLVSGLLMPALALAEEKKISGEASYRERIALPPNAVLTVQLADVSRADAPAGIVAEQTVSPAGQVPIPFELTFDTAAIQPRMNYALQARITVDDKLWFVTAERHTLDPLDAGRQELMLTRTAADNSQQQK